MGCRSEMGGTKRNEDNSLPLAVRVSVTSVLTRATADSTQLLAGHHQVSQKGGKATHRKNHPPK